MKYLNKKINLLFTAVAIIMVTIFTSCEETAPQVESAIDTVAEAKENLKQAQEEFIAEFANFKNETEAKIEANKKIIVEIKESMAKDIKSAKPEYKEQIAILEQKNSDLKKRINDFKADGKDQWQSFKREFNRDMDELGKSLEDFTVNNNK